MIMPRGQQLLLPANPIFILFTLLAALFANMVVNISLVGNAAWMPDFFGTRTGFLVRTPAAHGGYWCGLLFWSCHRCASIGVVGPTRVELHRFELHGHHGASSFVVVHGAVSGHASVAAFCRGPCA